MGLPSKGFGMSEAAAGSGAPLTCCMPCRNLIEPDQCTYNFTVSRIDVCLKKRQSQRWGGLEAPATRGLHPAFVSGLPAALQWGMGHPHHYQLPAGAGSSGVEWWGRRGAEWVQVGGM